MDKVALWSMIPLLIQGDSKRRIPHIKDLKTSDVQHPNEILSWQLGFQRAVDPGDHPAEHFLIHGLGEGPSSIRHLLEEGKCIDSVGMGQERCPSLHN